MRDRGQNIRSRRSVRGWLVRLLLVMSAAVVSESDSGSGSGSGSGGQLQMRIRRRRCHVARGIQAVVVLVALQTGKKNTVARRL